MAKTSRTMVRMPGEASRGQLVEITAIAQHDMESGFRSTERGERIARDIIREFVCTYNGVEVFRAQLHPGVGANPLIAFTTVALESGELEFTWKGDNEYFAQTRMSLKVS